MKNGRKMIVCQCRRDSMESKPDRAYRAYKAYGAYWAYNKKRTPRTSTAGGVLTNSGTKSIHPTDVGDSFFEFYISG